MLNRDTVLVFVIVKKKLFEFGNIAFQDDQDAASVSNKIVVGEDDRRSLIAGIKYLRFRYEKSKPNSNIYGVHSGGYNPINGLFDDELYWQWWNIRRSADSHRHTANPSPVLIEVLVNKSGNILRNVITGRSLNYILIKNELPCMLQVRIF